MSFNNQEPFPNQPSAPINPNETLEDFAIECPHCNNMILIEKLNCGIFRHGVIIATGKQMDPHAKQEMCESLIKSNSIYGCGKPFRIFKNGSTITIEICSYI